LSFIVDALANTKIAKINTIHIISIIAYNILAFLDSHP